MPLARCLAFRSSRGRNDGVPTSSFQTLPQAPSAEGGNALQVSASFLEHQDLGESVCRSTTGLQEPDRCKGRQRQKCKGDVGSLPRFGFATPTPMQAPHGPALACLPAEDSSEGLSDAGLAAHGTSSHLSVEDLKDINDLDGQLKAWQNSVKICMMQAEPLQAEALSLGVGALAGFTPEVSLGVCCGAALARNTPSRGQVAQNQWCVLQTWSASAGPRRVAVHSSCVTGWWRL